MTSPASGSATSWRARGAALGSGLVETSASATPSESGFSGRCGGLGTRVVARRDPGELTSRFSDVGCSASGLGEADGASGSNEDGQGAGPAACVVALRGSCASLPGVWMVCSNRAARLDGLTSRAGPKPCRSRHSAPPRTPARRPALSAALMATTRRPLAGRACTPNPTRARVRGRTAARAGRLSPRRSARSGEWGPPAGSASTASSGVT
jgi:hypothetical protein